MSQLRSLGHPPYRDRYPGHSNHCSDLLAYKYYPSQVCFGAEKARLEKFEIGKKTEEVETDVGIGSAFEVAEETDAMSGSGIEI